MALENKKETEIRKHTIKSLLKMINGMQERIEKIESELFTTNESINRVETFNGEKEFTPRKESAIKMSEEDKMVSVNNACMILPPNYVVNGRHTKENVSAICGFSVTDAMLDKIYKK